MISLTADDSWLLKDLGKFIEPVEVYDPKGKLLGLFVPANLERGKQLYADVAAKIDWPEIERRKQSKEKGSTIQEILGRLKLLETEMQRRKTAGEREFTTDEAMAYFRTLNSASTENNGPGKADVRTETDQCATP